jgi:hypothetical protein
VARKWTAIRRSGRTAFKNKLTAMGEFKIERGWVSTCQPRFGASLAEAFQKAGSIGVVAENVFAAIPTIDQVINCTRIFHTQLSWRGEMI